MKIAYLYFGQLRNFECNINNHMRCLPSYLDADKFVSTWTYTDSSDSKCSTDVLLKIKNCRFSITDFYPEYFYHINGVRLPQSIISCDTEFSKSNLPKFYHLKCAYDLLLSGHKEYDLIVCLRPDIRFLKKIRFSKPKNSNILHSKRTDRVVCDQFAVGKMSSMEVYCNTFSHLNSLWSKYADHYRSMDDCLSHERLLYQNLKDHGLEGCVQDRNHYLSRSPEGKFISLLRRLKHSGRTVVW